MHRKIPRNSSFTILTRPRTSWLKSHHDRGFCFAFRGEFRVSSSRERAVVTLRLFGGIGNDRKIVQIFKNEKLAILSGSFTDGLRWGWVFLERTRSLSRIQFTTHFIYCFVVETKRFVSCTVNVILTRQTCGQRSSMSAGSKRRALKNHFSERICYKFLISKCRGEWDLGLCTTSALATRMPLRIVEFRRILRPNTLFNQKSPPRTCIPFASTEVVHRPGSDFPLHFDIENI